MLCRVWSGSRETVSLDPCSLEDPRVSGGPGRPAAAAGGTLQHPFQGREQDSLGPRLDLQISQPIIIHLVPFSMTSSLRAGPTFSLMLDIKSQSDCSFWSVLVQVDGKHQDAGVAFERLQVDIEHLDLSKRRL